VVASAPPANASARHAESGVKRSELARIDFVVIAKTSAVEDNRERGLILHQIAGDICMRRRAKLHAPPQSPHPAGPMPTPARSIRAFMDFVRAELRAIRETISPARRRSGATAAKSPRAQSPRAHARYRQCARAKSAGACSIPAGICGPCPHRNESIPLR